jgi:DNA-binding transcriptional LysR family regulator
MDRLKALSIFKAVVDNGSFVGAANSLEISCPVVTRTVQDLEALLGVRLLHRTTRRIGLTAVGRDVLDRVAGLLQSYDELESIGRLSASEPSGAIRLSAPALFGRHYLGPALAKFRQRFPRVLVGLDLREGTGDAVADGIDLALCLVGDLRPAQIARPLAQVEVGIYAAPTYLERRGEPEQPAELAEHDCLTSGTGRSGSSWSFTRESGGERRTVPVRVALQASHAEVLADAALHGAGIVMLPAFMAEEAVAQGRLQRLLPDWAGDPMSIHIMYGSRKNQPMSVRRLIEHLVDVLGDDAIGRSGPVLRLVADEVDSLLPDDPMPAALLRAPRAAKVRVRLAA